MLISLLKNQYSVLHTNIQRPPDLTNRLGQANYSLNPEIRYNLIFYEVKFFSLEKSFVKPGNSLKTDSLNPEASVILIRISIVYLFCRSHYMCINVNTYCEIYTYVYYTIHWFSEVRTRFRNTGFSGITGIFAIPKLKFSVKKVPK